MENNSENRSFTHPFEWFVWLLLLSIITYPFWGSILYLAFDIKMPNVTEAWEESRKKQSSYFLIKNNDANVTVLNDNSSITFKAICDNGALPTITNMKGKFIVNCKK